jgi:hypothetical protein
MTIEVEYKQLNPSDRLPHVMNRLQNLKNNKKLLNILIVFILFTLYLFLSSTHSLNNFKNYKIFSSLLNMTDILNDKNHDNGSESNKNENPAKIDKTKSLFTNDRQYKIKLDGKMYPKYVANYFNRSINFECLNKNPKKKVILFWNPFFGNQDYGFGLGEREPFEKNNCPVTNCETTNDKSRIGEADLVIVHMRDHVPTPPNNRPQNQRWVFLLYESPVHSADFTNFNGVFNLTATYRKESDFANFYEYGANFVWKRNDSFNENYDFSLNKNRFASGVISNCGATSQRLEYIRELQNYVSVDVFGACGKPCPNSFKNGQKGNCKEVLGIESKFYLAFENSVCTDYITEKFYDILNFNTSNFCSFKI